MNDLQKFLNDFLDFSNRTVLFTTMIILIVILIALVSFIRKKKKKKKLSTESSDGTEFNEDFNKENHDDSAAEGITEEDFSKDFSKDDSAVEGITENDTDSSKNFSKGNMDFSDSTIAEENQDDSAAEGITELNEDFSKDDSVVEDLTEEDFSKEDFSKDDSAESFNKKSSDDDSAESFNKESSDDKDFSKDESSEDEMEALLSEEDNDDLYSAEMIENFFGNLGKQEIGNAKVVVEEIKKKVELQEKEEVELQEKKEAPVELILHDQISVDEKEPEEVNKKEEEEEEKHTAITLIDGSDRVMVSIGEKFEAKHTKDFTIEVKDEPEITIAMQDGFVFDGRIHFFVSLSEALAKHITLKDVTEITGPKGSYSGYEIKLEVTDKGDLESIDCTRSFNYKKVKDAVLIIQLSLE